MRLEKKSDNHERGSALMVSIVLIFMMSLMGISAMRSANLDKRMSTNAVHKSRTLQAAESVTQLVLEDDVALNTSYNNQGNAQSDVHLNTDSQLLTEAEIFFEGRTPALGNGLGTVVGLMFRASGGADLNNVSASSNVIQGFYRPAPDN